VVVVVVPAILLSASGGRVELGPASFAGDPLVVAGAALLLDSVILRFAREGRGTLAPVDPPRFVVRGGAYRWLRNPMYVANVAVLLGVGLVAGSWYVLLWAAVMFVTFHAFVVWYEEPHLRAAFGEEYERYRAATDRWLPRVH
jgi:protein-S-isoprenylcysteine O-methyltransferase Ste14